MKNFVFGGLAGFVAVMFFLFLCVCSCCFFMFASLASFNPSSIDSYSSELPYVYQSGSELSQNKILLINVEGVILNQKPIDPLSAILSSGVVYGYDIKQQLVDATLDDTIKGVVLFVNSPGGTITGSKAIADGVEYFKTTTGKSVVAIGSGLVASGGYWAMSNADSIYLDPGSSIGSIGVIFGPLTRYKNVVSNQEVATLEGITEEYITSGKGKDLGNPYRDLSEEERSVLQKSVSDAYEDFVNVVATSREISADTVKNSIGAYLYGDKQALELKLVDKVLNIDDSILDFATTQGIENDYQIVSKEEELDFFSSLLGITAKSSNVIKAESICNNLDAALVIEKQYLNGCK
jgi:protease IV